MGAFLHLFHCQKLLKHSLNTVILIMKPIFIMRIAAQNKRSL
ncbi:hypothetical protein APA_4553 [Pseudanabaena sp. lw0831]|nr:hypothetical protein APA_4553 [Pseudanabaena sp. lw0831]